jgi:c-di-GMP-binding flagellar brake protein YcgR
MPGRKIMDEKLFIERRKYVRFNADSKINIAVKKGKEKKPSDAKFAATARNLSVEGLCFKSKKKFDRGQLIRLEITLPSYSKPLHLEGKVSWSHALRKKSEKGFFDTGIKLFTVEKADEGKFLGYICEKMMGRLGRFVHI